MPAGKHKSHSLRRVKRVTPSGKNVTQYKRRKPQAAHCTVTGDVLKGVPREVPSKIKSIPKSQRRPERPFGGVLSSKAARRVHIEKARS